jgi:hypothetical protein
VSAADDEADVDRVLGGDPSGFEGLVRRWQKPLVNLAFRFCQDRGRAEELAQEAFLRAYRSLGMWRKDAAFSMTFRNWQSPVRRCATMRIAIASSGGLCWHYQRDIARR